MRIYVTPFRGAIFGLDWPEEWRIPVFGEQLVLATGQSVLVTGVQWEFADEQPAVQLRVVE